MHSQLLNIIVLKFNSPILIILLGSIFPYCPAVKAIRRINSSSIDITGGSMLDLWLRMSVLRLMSGNTMKYSLSPGEIPLASPSGFPPGSGYISLFTPPLVTIHIHYVFRSIVALRSFRLKLCGVKRIVSVVNTITWPHTGQWAESTKKMTAVCYTTLQCNAVCYTTLQSNAMCHTTLQCNAMCYTTLHSNVMCYTSLQCNAVCYTTLQCNTVC